MMDLIANTLDFFSIQDGSAPASPLPRPKDAAFLGLITDLRAMTWLYVPLALFLGTVAMYWHRIQLRRNDSGSQAYQKMGMFVAAGIFLLMYMITKPKPPEPEGLSLSTAALGIPEIFNMRTGAIVLSGVVMLCQLCHHRGSGGGRSRRRGRRHDRREGSRSSRRHHHGKHHH